MTAMNLIEQIGKAGGKKTLPSVRVGDTVRVHYLIREGDKERIQPYMGIIIAIRGRGIARSVTVRRLVQGEGVERIFPLHSPTIQKVEVTRSAKVSRAKLYYLRNRVGKATRLRERKGKAGEVVVPGAQPAAKAKGE